MFHVEHSHSVREWRTGEREDGFRSGPSNRADSVSSQNVPDGPRQAWGWGPPRAFGNRTRKAQFAGECERGRGGTALLRATSLQNFSEDDESAAEGVD